MARKKKKNPRSAKKKSGQQVPYISNANDSKKQHRDPSLFEKLISVMIVTPDFLNAYWELIDNLMSFF